MKSLQDRIDSQFRNHLSNIIRTKREAKLAAPVLENRDSGSGSLGKSVNREPSNSVESCSVNLVSAGISSESFPHFDSRRLKEISTEKFSSETSEPIGGVSNEDFFMEHDPQEIDMNIEEFPGDDFLQMNDLNIEEFFMEANEREETSKNEAVSSKESASDGKRSGERNSLEESSQNLEKCAQRECFGMVEELGGDFTAEKRPAPAEKEQPSDNITEILLDMEEEYLNRRTESKGSSHSASHGELPRNVVIPNHSEQEATEYILVFLQS